MKKIYIILFFLFTNCFADQLIIEPDAGRTPLLNAIQQTKSSIQLAMYGFTDPAFMNALINAKKSGKNVAVLLEREPYKAENENAHAISRLRADHVNLQWPDKFFKFIHQKTFILDQQTAIVMTFNLTHSTFKQQRNFALIITDPTEVQEIQRVFLADWAHKDMTVSHPNLLWSPNNSREKIIALIKSAKSEIKMYAQDVSDYQVIGELAKAARRRVQVKILVSVSPEKLHSKKIAYLEKAGVIIDNSRHYYIHAKVIMIDKQRAMLGSINFTKSSLENNRELSIITQDPEVIRELNQTFEQDWQGKQTAAKQIDSSQQLTKTLRQLDRIYYHLNKLARSL